MRNMSMLVYGRTDGDDVHGSEDARLSQVHQQGTESGSGTGRKEKEGAIWHI